MRAGMGLERNLMARLSRTHNRKMSRPAKFILRELFLAVARLQATASSRAPLPFQPSLGERTSTADQERGNTNLSCVLAVSERNSLLYDGHDPRC